jgi:organic radical activating enzyme
MWPMSEKKSPNQINVENMQARMRDFLDMTSPTACSAKWLQSTTTLYNGHTHSCHHPSTHKIPLEELKGNPSALHNTLHKKQARAEMLQGARPSECEYCWNIEDLPGEHMSDRTYKSTDVNWSTPHLDRLLEAGADGDVNPSYLEVAFENTCNYKCAYCTPDVSSKWMEEIKQHGHYPTSWGTGNLDWLKQVGRFPIPVREDNPYIEAFWEWWPDLYPGLDTFRVTGGEPLLTKNLWRVLDYVKENPRKDFTIAINTNMDVPDIFIDRLIKYYNEIRPLIKDFQVFTSCEAANSQAEYIRFGMNYERFTANVRKFLEQTGDESRCAFMVTFNALSVTSFTQFLSDIYDLRVRYNPNDALNRIPIMISYLRWPPFIGMRILPRNIREKYAEEFKAFVTARTRNTSEHPSGRFYIEEIDQIDRLCEFMLTEESDAELERNRRDFGQYFTEYDRRRDTDFDATFPELSSFLDTCLGLHQI